jgi:hypothetical protein
MNDQSTMHGVDLGGNRFKNAARYGSEKQVRAAMGPNPSYRTYVGFISGFVPKMSVMSAARIIIGLVFLAMLTAGSVYEHEVILQYVSGSLILVVLGITNFVGSLHVREIDHFINGGEDEEEC